MLPPGGEGEIKVTLRPKGGHPDITKHIKVLSNDPKQPKFTLTVKATLLIDMVAQPPSVPIYNLAPGQAGAATFSVQQTQGSTATVKSVRIEDTKLFSLHELKAAPGSLATYEVRFAGRDVGISATNVIVETTGNNTPKLTIPVRASAAFNLSYPKRITLARRGSAPIERTLTISTRRGGAPKIKKVEDPDGLLDIKVHKPDGPSVSIHLRLRDGATVDDDAPHKLLVHTNDHDEPKLEIEYRIRTPGKKGAVPAARGSLQARE